MAFIVTVKGRPEARQGAHDDCVMARAILEEGCDSMEGELVLPFKRNPLHLRGGNEYVPFKDKSTEQPWAM